MTLSGRSLAVALPLCLVALGAAYWAGRHSQPDPVGQVAGTAPSAAAATAPGVPGARQVLYYRNPMGLPDTSPVPKKDPMGMDYIPVYADDGQDEPGVVRVSAARVQMLGVRTEAVARQALDSELRAPARVEVNERALVEVAPRFEGWIERLHVAAVGDVVRRGEPLATVYSPALASLSEELRVAQRLHGEAATVDAREAAAQLVAATQVRLRNWQAGAASADGARRTVAAPVSGVVVQKSAVQGARFGAGDALYRLADLSTVWVLAEVFEQDLARVKAGQVAEVRVEAWPERTFRARVDYVYPTVDSNTRSTPVRLVLDNPEGLLRPGLFAQVRLDAGDGVARLAVPSSALIDDGNRQVVLLALGDGRFKGVPVRVGARGREYVEVLEGVQEGDRVVVSANFLIDSESQLKAALANLGEAEGEGRGDGEGVTAAAAVPQVFHSQGRFESFDRRDGTLMLSHEAIPALHWPAMTMGFLLDEALRVTGLPADLQAGQPIRFSFVQGAPGEFVVTEMVPIDAPPAAAAHAGHGDGREHDAGRHGDHGGVPTGAH